MAKKKAPKNKLEFTKVILRSCMIAYICTIAYGYVYYIFTGFTMDLNSLFAFVGTPTITAIGFYVWKAKAENLSKHPKEEQERIKKEIKQSETEEEAIHYDGYSTDSGMGSSLPGCPSDSIGASFAEPEKEEHRMAEMGSVGSRKTTWWGDWSA